MIYELTLHILSDDTTMLDTLASYAPVKLDAKVWLGTLDEYSLERGVTLEGVPCLSASIRFNETLDRQAAWDFIKSKIKPAILAKILTGSYAKYHVCHHDEGLPCEEPTTVWSK